MTKPPTDWEAIEREYRAGQLSVSEIARQHSISHTAVNKRARRDGWSRNLAPQVREAVSARLVSDGVSAPNARETIALAEERGVQVVRSHQKHLGQLNAIATILADRLGQHLDGVHAEGPGIGDRESPADMLEKLTRTRAKVIQLERQAFSLDATPDGEGDTPAAGGALERLAARLDRSRAPRVPEPADGG